jgi:undecaprenyl-diphosphatase
VGTLKSSLWVRRAAERDLAVSRYFNRACRNGAVRASFALISRLGDGWFWYGLAVALPLVHGRSALGASLDMALVGLVSVLVYKSLKSMIGRSRPGSVEPAILLGADPLDQFSFPSGHTLHAVAFTIVATHHYPELALLVVPFTATIALSRLILGLHYPSDVVAGAGIGAALAYLCIGLGS